jgi:hypothetical protein
MARYRVMASGPHTDLILRRIDAESALFSLTLFRSHFQTVQAQTSVRFTDECSGT